MFPFLFINSVCGEMLPSLPIVISGNITGGIMFAVTKLTKIDPANAETRSAEIKVIVTAAFLIPASRLYSVYDALKAFLSRFLD